VNVYAVQTDEFKYPNYYEYEADEYDTVCELVAAESRGKARAYICGQYGLEYTHGMRIRLVASGLDAAPENLHTAEWNYELDRIFYPDNLPSKSDYIAQWEALRREYN
jgi:hypothetical protein